MSSSFSYELDEEQIRSTLLNGGEQEPVDLAWEDFEANYVQNVTVANPVKFKLPEFNLNINRNVVLPVIFIAALVGVSAIMLSFVDFKTNSPVNVEKALVPNPDNYDAGESKAASLINQEPEKVTEKPVLSKKDTVIIKPVAVATATVEPQVQTADVTPTVATNPNSLAARTLQPVQNSQPESNSPAFTDTSSKSVQSSVNPIDQPYGKARKKRRKITPEQIETIKAPSILGVESEKKEEEPELEIRLN